jgi:hypothetical protein
MRLSPEKKVCWMPTISSSGFWIFLKWDWSTNTVHNAPLFRNNCKWIISCSVIFTPTVRTPHGNTIPGNTRTSHEQLICPVKVTCLLPVDVRKTYPLQPTYYEAQDKTVHRRTHNSSPQFPILSQWNPIHTPKPIALRYILIPTSHLCLGLPSGLFPLDFPTKTFYAFSPLPCVPHALTTSFALTYLTNDIWRWVHIMKLLTVQLPPFSRHLIHLRSKYMVLYVLIFYIPRQQTGRQGSKHSPNLVCS